MDIIDYVSQKEQEVEKVASIRAHSHSHSRQDDLRDPCDVDYARILYSSSFRRLQGKMQLFIPKSLHFYRNRLTHSLEVSQIARSLAKRLGMQDVLTVQSCSLAHDIGNPPFGHAGEKYLSDCSGCGRFEGNAQTYRILTHLEEKHHSFNGLNLTLRTLFGVVKYPALLTPETKGLYEPDFLKITEWQNEYSVGLRTIDCEIMDISDEIAYAAHDLEDALKHKYFSIGELLYEFQISDFKDVYLLFASLVKKAREFASQAKAYETSEEYSILFRKELTSLIVDTLITDVGTVYNETKKQYELGYVSKSLLAAGLKKLTFRAIKRNPDVLEYEYVGKKILTGLHQVYMDTSFNPKMVLMPAEYRFESEWERTVLDYIGGMMDSYAISQYEKYFGKLKDTGIYNHRE